MLSETKLFVLNTYFYNKNWLLPFNIGSKNLKSNIKPNFYCNYSLIKFSVGLHIQTESARSMKMPFQSKIMNIKNSQLARSLTFTIFKYILSVLKQNVFHKIATAFVDNGKKRNLLHRILSLIYVPLHIELT